MGRHRPLLAAWASASFCAILQGAVTSKVWPDAAWLDSVAVLMAVTTPLAWLAGAALALIAPRQAPSAAGSLAGVAAGLTLFLLPIAASWQHAVPVAAAAWAGWLATLAGLGLWLRRRGEAELSPAGHLPPALIIGGVLCAAIGWITPAAPLALGDWPEAERTAPRPDDPNLMVISRAKPASDAVAFLTGAAQPRDPHAAFPSGRDVPSLAVRLAARGYAVAGWSGDPAVSRVRRFSRGFHLFDDSSIAATGLSAAAEGLAATSGVGRWLTAGWPFAADGAPAVSVSGRDRAQGILEQASEHAPFFLWLALPAEWPQEGGLDWAAELSRASGERGWWLWTALDPSGAVQRTGKDLAPESFQWRAEELAAEIEGRSAPG